MNQVVTIEPDGSISGLQRKRGQGLDLRQFGHAQIERASIIEWHATYQCWFVKLLEIEEPYGQTLDAHMFSSEVSWDEAQSEEFDDKWTLIDKVTCECGDVELDENGVMYFYDYEDAVVAEVAYLDALRSRGVF